MWETNAWLWLHERKHTAVIENQDAITYSFGAAFLIETQMWTEQSRRKPAISAEKGWDEKQKRERREQLLVDSLRLKESRDDEWIKTKQWAQIYLEFEIEIAAWTLSNPVCLHGFDPIPLWKVCQSIQERLEEEDENKDTSLVLHKFWREKVCMFCKWTTSSR